MNSSIFGDVSSDTLTMLASPGLRAKSAGDLSIPTTDRFTAPPCTCKVGPCSECPKGIIFADSKTTLDVTHSTLLTLEFLVKNGQTGKIDGLGSARGSPVNEPSQSQHSGDGSSGTVTRARLQPSRPRNLSTTNSSGNPGSAGSLQSKAKVSEALNSCVRGNPLSSPLPEAVKAAAPRVGRLAHSRSTPTTNECSGLPPKETMR